MNLFYYFFFYYFIYLKNVLLFNRFDSMYSSYQKGWLKYEKNRQKWDYDYYLLKNKFELALIKIL